MRSVLVVLLTFFLAGCACQKFATQADYDAARDKELAAGNVWCNRVVDSSESNFEVETYTDVCEVKVGDQVCETIDNDDGYTEPKCPDEKRTEEESNESDDSATTDFR